jgi:hypothetical protein
VRGGEVGLEMGVGRNGGVEGVHLLNGFTYG